VEVDIAVGGKEGFGGKGHVEVPEVEIEVEAPTLQLGGKGAFGGLGGNTHVEAPKAQINAAGPSVVMDVDASLSAKHKSLAAKTEVETKKMRLDAELPPTDLSSKPIQQIADKVDSIAAACQEVANQTASLQKIKEAIADAKGVVSALQSRGKDSSAKRVSVMLSTLETALPELLRKQLVELLKDFQSIETFLEDLGHDDSIATAVSIETACNQQGGHISALLLGALPHERVIEIATLFEVAEEHAAAKETKIGIEYQCRCEEEDYKAVMVQSKKMRARMSKTAEQLRMHVDNQEGELVTLAASVEEHGRVGKMPLEKLDALSDQQLEALIQFMEDKGGIPSIARLHQYSDQRGQSSQSTISELNGLLELDNELAQANALAKLSMVQLKDLVVQLAEDAALAAENLEKAEQAASQLGKGRAKNAALAEVRVKQEEVDRTANLYWAVADHQEMEQAKCHMNLAAIEEHAMDYGGKLPQDKIAAMTTKQLQAVLSAMVEALNAEQLQLQEEQEVGQMLPKGHPAKAQVASALAEHTQLVETKRAALSGLQKCLVHREVQIKELVDEIATAGREQDQLMTMLNFMSERLLKDISAALSKQAQEMKLELEFQYSQIEEMPSSPEKFSEAAKLETLEENMSSKQQIASTIDTLQQVREQQAAEIAYEFEKQISEGRTIPDADLDALLLSDLTVLGIAIEGQMLEQLAAIEILQEDAQAMPEGPQLEAADEQLDAMQAEWQAKSLLSGRLVECKRKREDNINEQLEALLQDLEVSEQQMLATCANLSHQEVNDVLALIDSELVPEEATDLFFKQKTKLAWTLRKSVHVINIR